MISKLTSKGRITVPKEVREFLNLKVGDKIQFMLNKEGKVEFFPVKLSLKNLKDVLPKPKKESDFGRKGRMQFTTVIEKDEDCYIAYCP
jgi:AbrB family looped-hinge helix DNA binding protein